MTFSGTPAALLQVAEETVDALDGVGLEFAGEAEPAADTALDQFEEVETKVKRRFGTARRIVGWITWQ